MPEYNAGDAKLRIVPDASNFKRDLEAKLNAIQVSFAVNVDVALAQARVDLERFRDLQQRNGIRLGVDVDTAGASAHMAAWRAEQQANALDVPLDMDGSAAETAARRAGQNAKSSFLSQFSGISSEVGKAFGSVLDIGKTIGITALVANIPAAVTAVAALGQALGQLSGAALVVPGSLATAGASIGTLAVGLSGIGDAYSAVSAAAEESSTGQATHAAAAASATTSLRNAVVDEAQAQKDVATARKDALTQLRDLNSELNGGRISEAEAINDAAKARRDLAKGGFKDALDAQSAQLRVAAADQRVIDAHNRTIDVTQKKAEADAKGVDGADGVVAANERLVRSQQSLASSQAALAQAVGTSNSAADKAADAMAKLSPQAADFVKTLVGIKPRWEDLKKTVSGNLFEGASTSFTDFVDNVLPNLKSGMSGIATAWNGNLKNLLSSLGSDKSKGLLDRILGNTADAQNRFNAAIQPLVDGIGTLLAGGSDAVPRLADAIGSVATRFASFIEAADKDGRLSGWIDAGLTGFTDLGNILLNIGKSFFSITDALGGGRGLLGSLREATEKMAIFLGSTEGQNKIRKFFQEGKDEIAKLRPIIGDIVAALPGIWDGIKAGWDVVRPPLEAFTNLLKDNPRLIGLIAEALIAKKLIDGVTGLFTSFKKINDLLTGMPNKVRGVTSALPTTLPDGTPVPASGEPAKKEPGARPGKLGAFAAAIPAIGWGIAATTVTYDMTQDAKDRDVDRATSVQQINDGLPAGIPKIGTPEADQILTGLAAQKEPGAEWVNAAPGGADGLVERAKRYAFWATHYNPNDPVPFVPPDVGSYKVGGPTKAGLAVLHDNEFVLSDRASKYPMALKHAMNEGKLDPNSMPRFAGGGEWKLGPTADPSTPDGGGGGGGIFGALQDAIAGAQNPINNAIGAGAGTPSWSGIPAPFATPTGGTQVVSAGPNPTNYRTVPSVTPPPAAPAAPAVPAASAPAAVDGMQHLTGGTPGPGNDPAPAAVDAPIPAVASSLLSGIPGLGGLGSLIGGDPNRRQVWQAADGSPLALDQIMGNLPDKLRPENIAFTAGQTLLGGVLGFFGLENSILSPTNSWNQAIQKATGLDGKGITGGGQAYDPSTVDDILQNGAGGSYATGPQALTTSTAASKGSENGLQVKTIAVKHAIESLFPQVKSIGGYRQDALQWHPSGRALDVMVSNLGNNDPTPADSKALGDAVYAWATGPQGQALGVYPSGTLWQVKDHYNHVHVALKDGGGYPGTSTDQTDTSGGDATSAGGAFAASMGGAATLGVGRGAGLKDKAHAAYLAAGMPPGEWNSFDQLISHESSWNPTNKNPGSTAYGLGQFLDSTWSTVGGQKTADPMQQLQYIFAYLKSRPDYKGSPATAWSLWNSRSPHWYANGGLVRFDQGGLATGGGSAPPSLWEQLVGGTKVAAGQIGDAFNWLDTAGGLAPKQGPTTMSGPDGESWNVDAPEQLGVGGWKSAIGRLSLAPPKTFNTKFGGPGTMDTGKVSLERSYPQQTVGGAVRNNVLGRGGKDSDNADWLDGLYDLVSNVPGMDFLPQKADGGPLRGPGTWTSDSILARVSDGEFVVRAAQVAKNPALFHALNSGAIDPATMGAQFAEGGLNAMSRALPVPPPPRPNFQTPAAKPMQPRPAPKPATPAPRATAPRPAAPPGSTAPPPPAELAPAVQAPPTTPQGQGPTASVAGDSDGNTSHVLPAVETGIKSAATAAGNAVSTAVSALSGGMGGGGGALISGLFNLGGKAATDLVNVASSFLVGNVGPGTTANAYGEQYRPEQKAPQTAELDPGRTYVFNGMDSRNIVDELRLKDAQDNQAVLAGYRG